MARFPDNSLETFLSGMETGIGAVMQKSGMGPLKPSLVEWKLRWKHRFSQATPLETFLSGMETKT